MKNNPPSFPRPKEFDYKKIISELEDEAKKGLPLRPWTDEENNILTKFHHKVPMRIIAEKLNRSQTAVERHIGRLNKKRSI